MLPSPTASSVIFSRGVTRAEMISRFSAGSTFCFAIERYTRIKRILPSMFSEEL